MSKDWDGEPTATNYNKKDQKPHKTHKVHMGKRPKKNTHQPGESSWKE